MALPAPGSAAAADDDDAPSKYTSFLHMHCQTFHAPVVLPVERSSEHALHSPRLVASLSPDHLDDGHGLHDVSPLASWYFPGSHMTHNPGLLGFPYLPKSHVSQDMAPLFVVSPRAHCKHFFGASSAPRRQPPGQSLQCSPLMSLNCPAPHAVHLALPFVYDDWPASQSEHTDALALSLTLPCTHWKHACSPVSLPNCPGRHGRQDAWPVLS